MDMIFAWDPKYECGNTTIDSQHRQLFELANEISKEDDGEKLQAYLPQLSNYTKIHFDDEEKVMSSVHFPEIHEHYELHNQIIQKLSRFAYYELNSEERITEFKYFVFEWVINHILVDDMKFISFYKRKMNEND